MCFHLRNQDFREVTISINGESKLSFAAAYGFRNIQNIVRKLKSGKCQYDFVEIMACPSGKSILLFILILQSINQSINRSIHPSINPSINQINQSMVKSINQSINNLSFESINQSTNLLAMPSIVITLGGWIKFVMFLFAISSSVHQRGRPNSSTQRHWRKSMARKCAAPLQFHQHAEGGRCGLDSALVRFMDRDSKRGKAAEIFAYKISFTG